MNIREHTMINLPEMTKLAMLASMNISKMAERADGRESLVSLVALDVFQSFY